MLQPIRAHKREHEQIPRFRTENVQTVFRAAFRHLPIRIQQRGNSQLLVLIPVHVENVRAKLGAQLVHLFRRIYEAIPCVVRRAKARNHNSIHGLRRIRHRNVNHRHALALRAQRAPKRLHGNPPARRKRFEEIRPRRLHSESVDAVLAGILAAHERGPRRRRNIRNRRVERAARAFLQYSSECRHMAVGHELLRQAPAFAIKTQDH